MGADGGIFEVTEAGTVAVTVNEAGVVTVTPVPDASTTAPTKDAATTAPGADASCGTTVAEANCSAATISAGAIPLAGGFVTEGAAGTTGLGQVQGYAYFYNDSMNSTGGTSTSCLSATALCTAGTTDVANATGTFFGAGIGFNLNQTRSPACVSGAVDPFTVPAGSVGLSYTLSNLPTGGARLIIGNASGTTGTDYCVTLTAASGTIAWTKFNSECWTDQGTFLTGPPAGPIHINIGTPSGTTAASFNYCVESLAFATTLPTGGGGTTTTNCNGSSCCEFSGVSASGDGSLTCYTFAQGTPNDRTFCGYQGTSTAYTGGGSGACQTGALANTDSVPNVGTNSSYFAAFPGPGGGFANGAYCGMCINVTYAGVTLMATVVDECPSGSNPQCGVGSNHLDLSAALARALGYGVGSVVGDPTGVTWEAAACPITANDGNIVVVWNSSGQAYFQNVVWPVASVGGATQTNGFWNVNPGTQYTLTDLIGHQLKNVEIPGVTPFPTATSLGVQFPSTCTN
jgi:hypothetical protein